MQTVTMAVLCSLPRWWLLVSSSGGGGTQHLRLFIWDQTVRFLLKTRYPPLMDVPRVVEVELKIQVLILLLRHKDIQVSKKKKWLLYMNSSALFNCCTHIYNTACKKYSAVFSVFGSFAASKAA